jgi:hypothetical protein
VGTAVQSHYSIKVKEMNKSCGCESRAKPTVCICNSLANEAEQLEIAKRAVELDIKEKMIVAITEMKDFDKLMRLKESVMIWTNTKF